jgi:hypothetical protein
MTNDDRAKLQAVADFIVEVAANPEANLPHLQNAKRAAKELAEILDAAIASNARLCALLIVASRVALKSCAKETPR